MECSELLLCVNPLAILLLPSLYHGTTFLLPTCLSPPQPPHPPEKQAKGSGHFGAEGLTMSSSPKFRLD